MGVWIAAARNLLKLLAMAAVLAAPFAVIGYALRSWYGAALFAFAAVLTEIALYANCDRFVISLVGAKELVAAEQPGLRSLVERLSAKAHVVRPRLFLVTDGYPRILAAGRPFSSALIVSRGLLTAASPAELEGLVAHELAHIRNRDVAVQTITVVIAASMLESSRLGGYLQRAFLFVLAPIASAFVHLALSPKRELDADVAAAQLCETPHGLADGLVRIDHASELVIFSASPVTEPLYPVNPFASDDRLARMFQTHPSFPERLRRLRELDPDWPAKLRK